MAIKALNKYQLKKIKNNLPNDGVKILSKDFGVSTEYIYMIFNGIRTNNSIIEKAIELVRKEKIRVLEQKQVIDSITK